MRTRRAITLIELLVVVAIVATLTALLLGAVQRAREAANRSACQEHMRQLALGFHNELAALGHFYASHLKNPTTAHSWAVKLLPYVEQEALHARFRLDRPWDGPENRPASMARVALLECPSDPTAKAEAGGFPVSGYAATTRVVLGVTLAEATGHGILPVNSKTAPGDVTDGLSNTLLLAECGGRPDVWRRKGVAGDPVAGPLPGAWARPRSDLAFAGSTPDGTAADGECAMNCANVVARPGPAGPQKFNQPYSFHPGGGNVASGDGAVRFLRESLGTRTLARLITRKGGEAMAGDEF